MSKVLGWLDRRKDESIQTFDNRINHLAAFHSGYAFFMYENYSSDLSAFSVYEFGTENSIRNYHSVCLTAVSCCTAIRRGLFPF